MTPTRKIIRVQRLRWCGAGGGGAESFSYEEHCPFVIPQRPFMVSGDRNNAAKHILISKKMIPNIRFSTPTKTLN